MLEQFHSYCCRDKKTLTFKELQNFLRTAQGDPLADESAHVLDTFKDYALEVSGRQSKKPTLTLTMQEVRSSSFLRLYNVYFRSVVLSVTHTVTKGELEISILGWVGVGVVGGGFVVAPWISVLLYDVLAPIVCQ